ncbi:polyprenyl synthetase family protein [Candidatus Beckwithbacteria bacterium]|nr:polyprenyl synthetase family protein [Candidatus Beckwithbacteria bacterium]
MQILDFLTSYQQQSKPYWQDFLKQWREKSVQSGQINQLIFDKLIEFHPQGKHFRGALAYLFYQIAGGKNTKEMLKASVAVELLQTALLITDDVFDNDDVRRGKPTIHRQWQQYFPAHNLDYGKSMALSTSIIVFHLIPLFLQELQFEDSFKQEALTLYCQKTIETIWGEVLDISTPFMSFDQRKGSYANIHKYKTVAYTAVWPILFGVILSGNKDGVFRQKVEQMAEIIGQIFQIQDDILGTFGEEHKTGKANDSDIKDARWTVLVEYFFSKANEADYHQFKTIYEQEEIDDNDVKIVKELFLKYQIKKLAEEKNQKLRQQGLSLIPQITDNFDYQQTLKNLLDYLINREK